jgi:hypothetical protein
MSGEDEGAASVADDPRWAEVAMGCYGLERRRVEQGGMSAELFRCRLAGTPLATGWATAPYLSWGGLRFEPAFDAAAALGAVREALRATGASHAVLRDRRDRFGALGDAAVHVDDQVGTFLLDLSAGAERIFHEVLPAKTRNQVRKGEREGVTVRVGRNELLADFHDVHARAWRDLGTPSHAPRFFGRILDVFGEDAVLLVGYHGGAAVSAALVLCVGGTLHHPYAATLRPANELSANNVLYWEIIRYGCGRGAARFDLGRSRPTQGTWAYKLSWGARAVPLSYVHVFLVPRAAPAATPGPMVLAATRAWRHLPLAVTRRLGPPLIRWEL